MASPVLLTGLLASVVSAGNSLDGGLAADAGEATASSTTGGSVDAGSRGPPSYETVIVGPPYPALEQSAPLSRSRLPGGAAGVERPVESLGDSLVAVPGAMAANRENHAQDLRLGIRGFGDRAAFGIRGIRVFVDGVPYTLPDGQTTLEDLDPGDLATLEIVRGALGALYGNAAGGALLIETVRPASGRLHGTHVEGGSFAYGRARAFSQGVRGPTRHVLHGHWQTSDGWREHGRAAKGGAGARFWRQGELLDVAGSLSYSVLPFAQDPGGLTAAEEQDSRRQAGPSSLTYDTGESAWLARGSLSVAYRASHGSELRLILHGQTRRLDNTIPRRYILLDRLAGGALGHYLATWNTGGWRARFSVGFAFDAQADQRKNFGNENGHPLPPLLLDEDERVFAGGLFASQLLEPWPGVVAQLAARYDLSHFSVSDRLVSDGDQSGERAFPVFSGLAGLTVPLGLLSAHASVGQSYETPTIAELTMQPGGQAGMNRGLEPQRAVNAELGLRARYAGGEATLTGFWIDLRDELIRFEDGDGRAYFRNAGRSHRAGMEAGLRWRSRAGRPSRLTIYASYTLLHAVFDAYEVAGQDLSGKLVPGVPRHRGGLDATWWLGQRHALATRIAYVHPFWANDTNDRSSARQWLWEMRAVYGFGSGSPRGQVFLAVRNLLSVAYHDNVRINATGERFFEPAPPLSVRAGLHLTWGDGG